jgi:hypothetical protein
VPHAITRWEHSFQISVVYFRAAPEVAKHMFEMLEQRPATDPGSMEFHRIVRPSK